MVNFLCYHQYLISKAPNNTHFLLTKMKFREFRAKIHLKIELKIWRCERLTVSVLEHCSFARLTSRSLPVAHCAVTLATQLRCACTCNLLCSFARCVLGQVGKSYVAPGLRGLRSVFFSLLFFVRISFSANVSDLMWPGK